MGSPKNENQPPPEPAATGGDTRSPFAPPAISLPKGGGAIRGIGEKFTANPVTGTGSLAVPIYASPGRGGFGPQLAVTYDSGAGNGPFGLGWNLVLPSIMRKTEKGLPRYEDEPDSDTFILSGAEDLVPVLERAAGGWVLGTPVARTLNGRPYTVRRYRPRTEGLFARIERWTDSSAGAGTCWRSISRDNVTTWYGRTSDSRIADPNDPSRIFTWLISECHDDKGNVISYGYKGENSDAVDLRQVHERNRASGPSAADRRSANRYLKRVLYGNRSPYRPDLSAPAAVPLPSSWCFELVFDYGDHDPDVPLPTEPGRLWAARGDPFSTYRAAFEVRTYRLCRRALMFHHFPGEAAVGADCLVRSTNFAYSTDAAPTDVRGPVYSLLTSVSQVGYQRDGTGYRSRSLPPLAFEYTSPVIDERVQRVDAASNENLPVGIDGPGYRWVDLDGEGLAGILTEQGGSWFYKRNSSAMTADADGQRTVVRFGPTETVGRRPSVASLGGGRQQLLDIAGDGHLDLVDFHGPTPGFFERTDDQDWTPFRTFAAMPVLDWSSPHLKFIDLTGDGRADILITEDEAFSWHPSRAREGFGPGQRVGQTLDEEKGPRLVLGEAAESVFLADLSGDGLTDLVRIRNGDVCYWPNLGYGRFGSKVTMDDAPWFDEPDVFDSSRLRLADIDGSGTTDIIYLAADGVHLYFNQSGNRWSARRTLTQVPPVDRATSVAAVDLLGNGTACLVWSSPLPAHAGRPVHYLDLMGGQKPHLLVTMANNLGGETRIRYAPSTRFYLEDARDGKPWITRLPFPVHCVECVTVTDKWRQTACSSRYSYHHGYFDAVEREFRGFGRVEQTDTEDYGIFLKANAASPYVTTDKTLYQPPVRTVTWYHTGAFIEGGRLLAQFEREYFRPGDLLENVLPQSDLRAEDLSADEEAEALRACRGRVLRQEIYELDVTALAGGASVPVRLFTTAYRNYLLRRIQPRGDNAHAVFTVAEREAVTCHYDLDLRQLPLRPDPRVTHTLNLRFDEYAHVLQSVVVAYPRLGLFEDDSQLAAGLSDVLPLIRTVQREMHLAYTETRVLRRLRS